MAIASWQDLCLDAVDDQALGRFYAQVLGLEYQQRGTDVYLTGPTEGHRIWINRVPEPHTVKNRVHLDVHCASVAELEALGARTLEVFPRWTVMADPEGNELCAFVRDEPPPYRLYELVIDTVDSPALAAWWAEVLGARSGRDGEDDWVDQVPGMPFDGLCFDNVAEGKTVKNRVHWDVKADPQALVAAGATIVRERGADIGWTVMADPEGNEFCAFTD